MTALTFSDVDVPTPTDDKPDTAPDTAFEYSCRVCGVELFYGGRGRKPVLCSEHKKSSKSGGNTGTRTKGQNAALAAQAADCIVQYTHLMAVIATVTGYTDTEEAISARQDLLREQCYNALITNPARARAIARIGGSGGDLGLALAIGMFATAVGSTAVNEYRAKKEVTEE